MTFGSSLTATYLDALSLGAEGGDQKPFLDRVLEDYRPEELPGVTEADLGLALANFTKFADGAAVSEASVRIIPAHGFNGRSLGSDLLEIVQPDAPFLVDSVMAEVGEAGVVVRAMFHPFIVQAGGRRSLIQVWL